MALSRFTIKNQKALKHASCAKAPPVMVIAGPNGVGKSTLLYAIKQRRATDLQLDGRVLYLSAHRIWRRQSIQLMHLWGEPHKFSDILAQDTISGFAGLRILEGNRAPDSADESFSAVKYSLSQFETRKQIAVNRMLDTKGLVARSDIGDIYEPVREITRFLLPHLKFKAIDMSARSNIRVLFERKDGTGAIDVELDDLSSGERAVVSLFMPFLEEEIDERLKRIEATAVEPRKDVVVLIDEPEIHLHPYLQGRLLEYLRALTSKGNVQFVLATHSPTLLSAADFDELYVLYAATGKDENQLVQLANSSDRLNALRLLAGDTFNLTTGRRLLCIEGEAPSKDAKLPTDMRLLELMCPELAAFLLLPAGGRSNAIETATRLRELLPSALGFEGVYALVDRDTSLQAAAPYVFMHSVAMIENLLLEPAAIWEFLLPHREKAGLSSSAEVERHLRRIASDRRDEEVSLRIQRRLPLPRVQARGRTKLEITASLSAELARVQTEFPSDDKIEAIVTEVTGEVDRIIASKEELTRFHGKEILHRFHQDFVNKTGVGLTVFCLQIARIIGRDEALRSKIRDGLRSLLDIAEKSAKETIAD